VTDRQINVFLMKQMQSSVLHTKHAARSHASLMTSHTGSTDCLLCYRHVFQAVSCKDAVPTGVAFYQAIPEAEQSISYLIN